VTERWRTNNGEKNTGQKRGIPRRKTGQTVHAGRMGACRPGPGRRVRGVMVSAPKRGQTHLQREKKKLKKKRTVREEVGGGGTFTHIKFFRGGTKKGNSEYNKYETLREGKKWVFTQCVRRGQGIELAGHQGPHHRPYNRAPTTEDC